MIKRAAGHIQFLLWAFSAILLAGWLSGYFAWVLALSFGAYIVWTLIQALRLHAWLYDTQNRQQVPESYGLWGDLFEGLYQLEQKNQSTQRALRNMIDRVRSSSNALKDAVIMTDALGHMDWWNESAARTFGFRRDKDRGELLTNLIRAPGFKKYFEAKEYAEALEFSAPHHPDTFLRFEITLFGEDERLIVVHDVTRLHRLEQMRRDFVSNVSHEMRTPLTVIRGYLETLLDAVEAADAAPKWQRPMRTMMQQAQRLEVLLNDLLLLEKYETEDVQRNAEVVDVGKLLQMVCHDAEVFSGERSHRIRLECTTQAALSGMENQLRSAFSNLIYNAVKYTPDGGDIRVRWWQDEKGAHVSVSDNGCGFDPIHIPRLTERFYRADPSRDHATGGSGLGLAIVKHVLINHGGRLEIHSQINKGSEFICHFPSARVIQSLQGRVASG
jgi:two-component system phosphate regulon sensor histidine kinase PhoR